MKNMYIVYDNKAQMTVGPILLHENHTTAIRSFDQLVQHPETDPHRHPNDYDLVYLGHFNNEGDLRSIAVDGQTAAEFVCSAADRLNPGSRGEQLTLDNSR